MKFIQIMVVFVSFFSFSEKCFSSSVEPKQQHMVSVQEYYSTIVNAFQEKNWQNVLYYSRMVLSRFPTTIFSQEILYYQAVAYFHLKEYEMADQKFSQYLKQQSSLKFFEETLSYKFLIAESYRQGEGKHVLGWKKLPKWISGKEDAIKLYDEILHAIPLSDVAVKSLFAKGQTFFELESYPESLEAFDQLIRHYPKHELAIESFLAIGKVYWKQSFSKNHNFDLLDLAEVNLKKFQEAFPKEDRVEKAKQMILEMQEIFAQGLFDVGSFFERRKQKEASILYYTQIVAKFPATKVAKLSQERLLILKK